MEVSNVITILLFILPGMLSDKITHMLDYPTEKDPSDFMKTVNGILSSMPILFINSIFFTVSEGLSSLEDLYLLFNNLNFLGYFIISVFLTSILFGLIRTRTEDYKLKTVNFFRKSLGKMEVNKGSCWEEFTIGINEKRYLEVIINGNTNKGFAGAYSTPDETMALTLETDAGFYDFDDYDPEKLFTKVIRTYIDIEKNVVIKDYDMTEFYAWCNTKTNESIEEKVEATS